jgi:hypothetical protein
LYSLLTVHGIFVVRALVFVVVLLARIVLSVTGRAVAPCCCGRRAPNSAGTGHNVLIELI